MALLAVSALCFVVTAVGGSVAFALAVADGRPGGAFEALALTALGLVFWRWIALGAQDRTRPDPDAAPAEPIGPWGVVGRLMLMVLVIGVLAAGAWGLASQRRIDRATDRVRAQAESLALDRGLTAARIDAAARAHRRWLATASDAELARGDSPLQRLLPVTGAEVVAASVRDGQGALLLRLPESPPCVVLVVDRNDDVGTRLTGDCRADA